ncbi:MAG TPA: trypsin-like peptidase domain-containing protein [Vicinamibacterales bacterium]
MHRLVLRHLTGSKSQQVEEIPIDRAGNLLLGRDDQAHVRYDPNRDDLVSKEHARIIQDAGDKFRFSIVDLNSRNGTFVNGQRVSGTAALSPGDRVQLGPGGPEFQFTIDPMPPHMIPKTVEAPKGGRPAIPPTVEAPTMPAPPSPQAGKTGIGQRTLERRLDDVKRDTTKRFGVGIAAAVVLLLAVGAYFVWDAKRRADEEATRRPWTTEQTAAAGTPSTVLVEFAWKLVFRTGEQIYHQYYIERDSKGQPVVDAQGNPRVMPLFEMRQNKAVPVLTLDRGTLQQNRAISCGGAGSGFAVTTDGFIMTNRHVAANWETRYQCFPRGRAALYLGEDKPPRVFQDISMLPVDWVPASDGRELSGKRFEGQNIYLDVTFKLNKLRFPATVARVSDRADVSLIKINSPTPVKKVETLDNYNEIAVGHTVVVMGYPAVSPDVFISTASIDPISREQRTITIPDTTVTPGSIGRVIRGQMKPTQGTVFDYSSNGMDAYQLTINTTGAGNSGGPVFDDHGHVIGIFTYSMNDPQGTKITFAVPIRYGLELMGTAPAVVGGGNQ